MSGYQTLSEIRTILQPDNFRKRRNPDVRISDTHCICIFITFYWDPDFGRLDFGHPLYSRCLKSGRPDFGVFKTCPVVKTSGFQMLSEIRTLSAGFQTSSSNALNKGNRTISNRTSENRTFCPVFRHYENPMCLKTGHSVRISDRLVPKPVC